MTSTKEDTDMMKQEFEAIAKIKVTDETYYDIIEPMYYATNMTKQEFVKCLKLKAFAVKEIRKPCIKKMLVRDHAGYTKTPNGCYYHIQYVDMIGVDIATGKIIIDALDDDTLQEISKYHSLDLGYEFDFDYTKCVDKKKNPIALDFGW